MERLKAAIWRRRHRKSREQAISFQLGMAVGAALCDLIGQEETEIIVRRIDTIREDYS